MPEFIPILIGSLIVFIGLLLAFGGLIVPVSETETITMKSFTIATDFTVSDTTGEELVQSITNGTVSGGLVSSVDESISFELPKVADVSEGTIDLHVIDTNLYGPLIIKVNDYEVYSGYPRKGDHTIKFPPEVLKLNNVIDIKAGSPGLRFWAPTIYVFDANFSVSYFSKKTLDTTFDLTEKLEDIEKVKVVVNVGNKRGTGKIIVRLNGAAIYAGFGTSGTEFSKIYLKEGENKVEISTQTDAVYTVDLVEIDVWS